MKVIALTILLLALALIAFATSRSRKQTSATPDVRDYLYAEPFRGSVVGKTLARSCGYCHVVPISWWIQNHVREGREELNFSEWTRYTALERHNELESICGVVSNGRMPPASYRALHPESRLEAKDKNLICAWAANESEHEK